jgi:hypothetical protein
MVSIPASLIATFIGIYLLGYTLNLMSLLGLSLVVGILVMPLYWKIFIGIWKWVKNRTPLMKELPKLVEQ